MHANAVARLKPWRMLAEILFFDSANEWRD